MENNKDNKDVVMGAATEAATGAAASASMHRHYSVKIFGRPQISGGPLTTKIFRLAQVDYRS